MSTSQAESAPATRADINSRETPIVRELSGSLTPALALDRLCHLPRCLLLESSLQHHSLGRFSFITADPFEWHERFAVDDQSERCGREPPFQWLVSRMAQFAEPAISDLPPFQGGAAGLFSYDLNRSLESIRSPRLTDFQLPVIALGLFDVVLAWDHDTKETWLISQGLPEKEPRARRRRAISRADEFEGWLAQPSSTARPPAKSPAAIAQQFTTDRGPRALTGNMNRDRYLEMVQAALDYIASGDVYQVNLAQRLLHPATSHAVDLYQRLRECNASTFGAYFDLGEAQIVSASPERLISVCDGVAETRPIKGTRKRTRRPEVDWRLADDLRNSAKDRAENVMIVDLMRNDLSRICHPDSVKVSQLLGLEEYASVFHLVSAVQGSLMDVTAGELLGSIFPGGSITGAPKIRAMEIIAELEPTARGAYCGSVGYIGFNGSLDLNILIRTITAAEGWWQIPVGGGIVSQSIPHQEYDETWTKAASMLQAL